MLANPEVDAVDAALAAVPSGAWMTCSEIAAIKGISKQAVHKRVTKLRAENLLEVRVLDRGVLSVNLAQFDRVTGETTDAVRAMNSRRQKPADFWTKPIVEPVAAAAASPDPIERIVAAPVAPAAYAAPAQPVAAPAPAPVTTMGDLVLAREQARRASYDADLKQLELEERLGKLIRVDDVERAMQACAEAIVNAINQLPSRADDLASSVAREGAPGARAFLKTVAMELRDTMARSLRLVGSGARPDADADDAA